ncbi:hypothetical protein ERJ75_001778300 [Trypanosoma vivax]|nr:hypothetical protein ERJ75_001778300 [Trypanosoma vivax]
MAMRCSLFAAALLAACAAGTCKADSKAEVAISKANAENMCEIAGLLKGAAEGVSKALSETREKLRTETEAVAKVEARLAALESIGCRAVTPNMRGEVTQMRNALLSAETKLKEAENTGGAAALSAATLGGAVEGFVETLFTHQASTAAGKCIVDDSTAASGALGSLTKFIAWGAKAAAGSTPGRGTCATVEVVLKSETAITTNFTEKLDTLSDAIVIKQANAGRLNLRWPHQVAPLDATSSLRTTQPPVATQAASSRQHKTMQREFGAHCGKSTQQAAKLHQTASASQCSAHSKPRLT